MTESAVQKGLTVDGTSVMPELEVRAGSGTFLFYLGKVQILSPKKYLGTGTGTGSSSVPRYFTGTLPKYLGTFQVL